jgi:imidazolonepropionase-like amidohydrolase
MRVVVSLAAVAVVAASCSKAPELVRMPTEPPAVVTIENVHVLDVERGVRLAGRDVIIRDGKIEAIHDAGSAPARPDAFRIDGSGATLVPGLIDMHGHVGNSPAPVWYGGMPDPDWNIRAFLYAGVTTVLDPCDLSSEAFARRDAVARGEKIGPRIYAAGPMVTAKGGHPVPLLSQLAPWWIRWYLLPRIAIEVDSPEAARAAVAQLAEWKADVVKLAVDRLPTQAPRIRRELLDAVVAEAKAKGLRSAAHIGTTDDARDAAAAGVSLWLHGVYKERIPDERIAELAAFRIPMVPTMIVFESYALGRQQPRIASPLERQTYPEAMLTAFDRAPEGYDFSVFEDFIELLRANRENWRDNVRRLRVAGVTILAGSDAQSGVFPGGGLHRELALLVESGMTPAEAIRAATLDAARWLADGKEPELGSVAPGKVADLLLVEGDPTADLAKLAEIRAVLKGGVPVERIPLGG